MPLKYVTRAVGGFVEDTVQGAGNYAVFVGRGIQKTFRPLVKSNLLFAQLEFVGNRSLVICILAGIMIGGIFGFQLGEIFVTFGTESMLGASTGFALARELAPVVGAFLVTARAGSAMAAEIASMKVNEQIDAMRVMAVDPYNYLVAPRILASVLMMPLLSSLMVVVGVAAAYVVGVYFYNVDVADFFSKIEWIIDTDDLFMGIQKSMLFGFIFASIGCYEGFNAQGGAKGVGRATTRAVVNSYVAILILDFFITYFQFKFQADSFKIK
ncbi:MAG: ABC transporter permease [Chitinophagaceae bacterium]|nr:ABC transporter permease [Oligoflexus sp.]